MPEALVFIVPIVGLIALVGGAIGGAWIQQRMEYRRAAGAEMKASRILGEAERRQKELLLEAKEESIRLRNQVYEPDHLVILDPSLIAHFDVTQGLKKGGIILVNTDKDVAEFEFPEDFQPIAINAARIALDHKVQVEVGVT